MILNGLDLARGWLAVALASAKDPELPSLNRTVHIEQFHNRGARLVAADQYMMLHCWVADDGFGAEPDIDEAPDDTVTVMDLHNRGVGLFKHVLKVSLAAAKEGEADVSVSLNVTDVAHLDAGTFPGMEPRVCQIKRHRHPLAPGDEKLALPVYDGVWAPWRDILQPKAAAQTATVAVNPDIIGRLSAIRPTHPHALLGFVFTGKDKPIHVQVIDSEPYVHGVAMPVAWDFTSDKPREPEPVEGGDGE